MQLPRRLLPPVAALGLLAFAARTSADQHVAVTAFARTDYTQRKYENGQPRVETYVFMQGRYFDGRTRDRSIEQMTFRQLVESLAPALARQQYLPTMDPKAADLLLVVHWGTTVPLETVAPPQDLSHIPTRDQIMQDQARTDAVDSAPRAAAIDGMSDWNVSASEPYRALGFGQLDQTARVIEDDLRATNNAQLLGYTRDLGRLQQSLFPSATEATLLSDLASERYFIIIKAYDLKDTPPDRRVRRPVWTIHLNIRSPGQNFPTALARMGNVAVDYLGRNTDAVVTALPRERAGTVTLGPMIIVGEVPDPARAR